jgi:hypothetical protein
VRHSVEVPELLALGRDLGWPALTLGGLAIDGEAGWRGALTRAVPGERRQLLAALEPALLSSTDIGKLRLQHWIATQHATPATPMSREQLDEWILDKLFLIGDKTLLGPIVSGLAHVPPCVRAVALAEVCWVAVGRHELGWTAAGQFADRDGVRRFTIAVSGAGSDESVERIVAHEAAHVWHLPIPDPDKCVRNVVGLERLLAHLARTGSPAPALAQLEEARDERCVCALEAIWSSRHDGPRITTMPGRSSDEHG